MVLDPFSALSLASSIVQFVDFSSKLVAGTYELYKSVGGVTAKNAHLEILTKRLSDLSDALGGELSSTPDAQATQNEEALRSLATSCKQEAEDLLKILFDLKVDDPHHKLQTLRQALRNKWKAGKIKELEERLNNYRNGIGVQLVAILSDQTSGVLTAVRDLMSENKRMNINRTHQLEELVYKVESISKQQSKAVSKSDFAELHATLTDMSTAGSDLAAEQRVLDSLRFHQMASRHSKISQAHTQTFRWIFKPATALRATHHDGLRFLEWLQASEPQKGIYWVAGKAGSGKSTLMKFICDHSLTQDALQEWARPKTLVMASFFFWHAGNTLQKSLEGLMRTLLFEILRKCPHLIPSVLPEMWKCSDQIELNHKKLLEAFSQLAEKSISTMRFCFFIDGLDEYAGNPLDVIETLQRLAASGDVKVCLSSRPWPVFKDAFDADTDRRLYLQDLTRGDITLFVKNKLQENHRFIKAKKEDPRYQGLVVEIVDRAKGVFLWVFLVVRSILDGLPNEDSLKTLQTRLRSLPTDLEEFFQHMLNSIDRVYQLEMARSLQMALTSRAPLPLLAYSVMDELEDDPRFALDMEIPDHGDLEPFTQYIHSASRIVDAVHSRETKMQQRLNARTKGLLEISSEPTESLGGRAGLALKEVDFLHRTVGDFLKQTYIKKVLAAQAGSLFVPSITICHSFLAILKMLGPIILVSENAKFIDSLILDFVSYAHEAEIETSIVQAELLDNLEKALSQLYPFERRPVAKRPRRNRVALMMDDDLLVGTGAQAVFSLCIQQNLTLYVKKRLDRDPLLLSQQWKRPPLLDALLPSERVQKQPVSDSARMVQLLLKYGANPNEGYENSSVWGQFLQEFIHNKSLQEFKGELPELLLKAKADPNVRTSINTLWGDILLKSDQVGQSVESLESRAWLLDLFLTYGADPNAPYEGSTIWNSYLTILYKERDTNDECMFLKFTEIKKLLLRGGANPDIRIWKEGKKQRRVNTKVINYPEDQSVDDAILAIFIETDQAKDLLSILAQRRASEGLWKQFRRWVVPWK